MSPVYLSGLGLACSRGLNLNEAVATLGQDGEHPAVVSLPGALGGDFPYHGIPFSKDDWNERARELVQRVADEAGAARARAGALFIATSSFDVGAAERGQVQVDYPTFANKVASWLSWTGPVYLVSTACTSSLNALLAAHALLTEGEINDALVLGLELDNKLTPAGFAALQLLSRHGSKPFASDRDGLVLGEAVAAIRLSTRDVAAWQMSGGANVVDGQQPTGASAAAVVSMYRRALERCSLVAENVDLIKVQAAGSPGNDAVEAQGLHEAFSHIPPLLTLKHVIGHTMGASGAAEIALLLACLEQGVWPVQARETDVELDIKLAAQMPQRLKWLMATILGFGGSHATVVLERR